MSFGDASAVDAVASGQLTGLDDHQQQILRRSLSELGLLDTLDGSDDDADVDGGLAVASAIVRPRVRTDPVTWSNRPAARSRLNPSYTRTSEAMPVAAPAAAPALEHPRPMAAPRPMPQHQQPRRHTGSPPPPPPPGRSPPPPPTAPPPRHTSPPAPNGPHSWAAPIPQHAPITTFAVPIGAAPPPPRPPPGPPPRQGNASSPPPPPGPPPPASKPRTSPAPHHHGLPPHYAPVMAAHVVPMLVTVPMAPPAARHGPSHAVHA